MSDPTTVYCPERRIVGIGVRTTNAEEADPETACIPGLWDQFLSERTSEKTPDRVDSGIWYGVYMQYESDHHGPYRLILGVEVATFEDVPEGFESVFVPEGTYDVFIAEGEMPESVSETWEQIWAYYDSGHGRPRAYAADFERYDADNPSRVEIYVSVS